MSSQPMIEELKKIADVIRRKIEEAKSTLAQGEEDLRNILGTIAFYERNTPILEITLPRVSLGNMTVVGVFGASSLRGMSHRQAVITIAKHNGGIVRAQEAKRLMITAGVMRDTKNATHMVHNAIISSERFDRIGRGEYRLRVPMPMPSPTKELATALATGVFPPKNPVQ
jgi:hypothetical protein